MPTIETIYPTGNNLYAVIQDPATAKVWNTGTLLFEAYSSGHWANYAIALAERAGTGYYSAAYPAQIVIRTSEVLYLRAGGSPTVGDVPVTLGNSQGNNMAAINGSVAAANNAGLAAGSEVQGAAQSGTLTTTQMSTGLAATLNGAYVGRTVIWTSGVLAGVAAAITGYASTNGVLTFTQVPSAPSPGDAFIIV
jgi:hypothetical protein